MTRGKLYLTLAASTLLGFGLSQNAQAKSLEDALAAAYKNNPTLQAERERLKSIDENLPAAYSGWLPTFKGVYERSRENEKLGNNPEDHNTPTTKSLTMDQNVFAGGRTYYSIEQANNTIRSGRENLRNAEQQVLLQAITAYIDVVKAREVVKLSRNNEKVLKEQLTATNDRFKLGEATKTDVSQSESRQARAEADRITAEGQLITAESEYYRIYEENPSPDMTLPGKIPSIPETYDQARELALAKNPVLKRAEYDSAAADDTIGVTRSSLLPTVGVKGDITRVNGDSSTLGVSEREDERITLNVTVPIFQSGSEYASIRQAKRRAESSRYNLRDAQNVVISDITTAWHDIETTRSSIRATSSAVKSAQIALEGVRQEQKVGSRTVLDILDAEQEYFNAQVNLITARRNEIIAAYNLKAALGELSAKDLGLNVEIYDPDIYLDDVKYQFIGY